MIADASSVNQESLSKCPISPGSIILKLKTGEKPGRPRTAMVHAGSL